MTIYLTLATLGITIPATALVWLTPDGMDQSSDMWVAGQMMITVGILWPIVIFSAFVRWPAVISAAAGAWKEPPEWQEPAVVRNSVAPNGDFWEV